MSHAGLTGAQRLPDAERVRRLERVSLAVLFVVSLALRWLMSDGDFYGDEAWYFYLARSFGGESAAQAEHPLLHIANRPLFYAFFNLSTYGGLWSFRLAGCCVGACIPPLAWWCARAFGASRTSAAIAALALSVQPQQLRYSANVFPDVLAACFALGACWAAARRSAPWTVALCVACVWSKESFVFVPVIATWLRLDASGRLRRPDLSTWLTCGIPVGYVATVTAISLSTEGVRLQGWSASPFTLDAAQSMLVGPEVWPWLLWLAWRREARILVLWLGLPLFYIGWTEVLGRGIEDWYAVGPATLAFVAAALGFDALRRIASWRTSRAGHWLILSAALLSLSPAPIRGLLLLHERTVALAGRWPQPRAAPEVVAILKQLRPKRVIVLDCFWAYRYSHLRGRAQPGIAAWWASGRDTERVIASARKADMVVACREPGHEAIQAVLKQQSSATLLETKDWLVLRPRPRS
jgi:hypothetical protein